ncbi:hypothetical protein MRX96_013930 [Rhipicephalus microplus]
MCECITETAACLVSGPVKEEEMVKMELAGREDFEETTSVKRTQSSLRRPIVVGLGDLLQYYSYWNQQQQQELTGRRRIGRGSPGGGYLARPSRAKKKPGGGREQLGGGWVGGGRHDWISHAAFEQVDKCARQATINHDPSSSAVHFLFLSVFSQTTASSDATNPEAKSQQGRAMQKTRCNGKSGEFSADDATARELFFFLAI